MLEKRGTVAARYPESVATTWAVNIEQLGEAQRDVLRLSSFLVGSRLIDEFEIRSEKASHLLNRTGYYLTQRGLYLLAEPLYKQALEIRRKVLGEEHPDFATSLWWIAVMEERKGHYDEAETLVPAGRGNLHGRSRTGTSKTLVATSIVS